MSDPTQLVTFGHGTATESQLRDLLLSAGVQLVVDVRRYPGSRAHPHVARERLQESLPAAGITYRWEPKLGGRRALPPESPDTWWQVTAFRAYAAHMRTPEFRAAVDVLLMDAAAARTAVMCSESLWWRCHRRLIADFVMLVKDKPVSHLGHNGKLTTHAPAAGARVGSGGLIRYDEGVRPE